ncbi:pilus assembly protein TadG-related protein [Sinomonas sp. R1AF57]|uniref:pilus assembly protein TadG-related protein n=1 Tax=Sinomonas sp. R1AF57 TaxID=2020377 RepID=UPI001ABF9C9D|nr:pilus assembly protein TadG-related protein [Sinomonas sp. R1AF57]
MAIVVALLMVVLVGFAALAVDIGRIASTKAQLQNGADASALAVAQLCSKVPTDCTLAKANSLADQYALANTLDTSGMRDGPVDLTVAGHATVNTRRNGDLNLLFGGVLGETSARVTTSATAVWGYPAPHTTFPLALSDKCFDLSNSVDTGKLQKFTYKKTSGGKGTDGQCYDGAVSPLSGGFGWLSQSGDCKASITGSWTAGSDPGNSVNGCDTILQQWKAAISKDGWVKVTLPVFAAASGNGAGGTFTIRGFATFQIYGWMFAGAGNDPRTYQPASIPASLQCSGSERCIIGKFVKYETAGQQSETTVDPSHNLYTTTIGLVK